jgi:hypothetical protein
VLEAAAVFEAALAHAAEGGGGGGGNATAAGGGVSSSVVAPPAASSTDKNLGLAYVRLVRSAQALLPTGGAWPAIPGHEVADEAAFRLAAPRRVLQLWGRFLAAPGARADGGYESIRQVVAALQAVVVARGEDAPVA